MLDSVTNLASLLKDPTLLVTKAYVAGQWIDADDGTTFPVTNPARGDVICQLPNLGRAETARAIAAANVAMKDWAARTGKELVDLKEATVTAVLSKLGELQGQQVRMLNIDSLLTAFDNYVERARAGGIGVPINYYLKPITRNQLAQMWMSKYYPGRYLAISGDDSATAAANPDGGEAQQ